MKACVQSHTHTHTYTDTYTWLLQNLTNPYFSKKAYNKHTSQTIRNIKTTWISKRNCNNLANYFYSKNKNASNAAPKSTF